MEKAAVTIVRSDSTGNYLCVKRAPKMEYAPGSWSVPGGHMEEGETPEETALREFWEETKVSPSIFTKVKHVYEGESNDHYVHYFLCNVDEEFDVTLDIEHTEYKWEPSIPKPTTGLVGKIVDKINQHYEV